MRPTKPFSTPLLLGFEISDSVISQLARANDGYPPYNIELIRNQNPDASDKLRITLAVAGFDEGDLEITVEGNQLIIRGRQSEQPNADYLFRGIAARQFQRSFVLADGMDVASARLSHGLLIIELFRPNLHQTVRKINISASN
ncbi:HSP20 family molecular chaperone IbpA [Agrobacterium vitis]|nr:HSP20 family molecular chaperone IbpA [Agrobacterium vitis]MBE1437378.1 HSP20 family molecular chaperone IbpA [Agrobacterium vitis]